MVVEGSRIILSDFLAPTTGGIKFSKHFNQCYIISSLKLNELSALRPRYTILLCDNNLLCSDRWQHPAIGGPTSCEEHPSVMIS